MYKKLQPEVSTHQTSKKNTRGENSHKHFPLKVMLTEHQQNHRAEPQWCQHAGKSLSIGHESESESEVAHSCLTLCDPMDCSLPGSSVHGIFQARVLELGAICLLRFLFATTHKWMHTLVLFCDCSHRSVLSLPRKTQVPCQKPCL